MKNHRRSWQRQCLLGLSSLCLSGELTAAQASSVFERDPRLTPVFSQATFAPQKLLLSQRLERRDGAKLRDKLRRQPDGKRRDSSELFDRRAASVKQAAKIAQQQHGGKVLKVERNKQSYRVKMLREGRVSYVQVPAQ